MYAVEPASWTSLESGHLNNVTTFNVMWQRLVAAMVQMQTGPQAILQFCSMKWEDISTQGHLSTANRMLESTYNLGNSYWALLGIMNTYVPFGLFY